MDETKKGGIFFSATVPPDTIFSLGLFQPFFGIDIPGEQKKKRKKELLLLAPLDFHEAMARSVLTG